MMISCQCIVVQLVSCQEIGLKTEVLYGAPESGWPSSDSSWQYYYILGTTTKLSMPFQVLAGVVVILERNILGRLRCNCN